jgi:cell division protein FtsZ
VQPDARPQVAQRPAPASQSFASIPAARSTQPPASVARAHAREDTLVFSSRRPQAPSFAQSAQPNLPIRDRITLPAGLDSEWDTPTFQRKGQ